jgi:hypothetical protein
MKFLLLTFGVVCGLFASCERHEFEGAGGTKQLHESHGAGHGADQSAGHGSEKDVKPAH